MAGASPDEQFTSIAQQAAQTALEAAAAAEAAQAAAEQALADTLAALAAQIINDHADVTITTPADNEVLMLSGGGATWINQLLSTLFLSDIDLTGITADQVVAWNGSQLAPLDPSALVGLLPLAGGTMTGALTLAGDPVSADEAANKSYVDAQFGTTTPYDILANYAGAPSADEFIFDVLCVRNFFLPAGLTLSRVEAGLAATAAISLIIQKNGSPIGSIDFAAAANTATFTFTTLTNFVPGDNLTVVNASTADATLADISFALVASLGAGVP
jgi:hypothetical protein